MIRKYIKSNYERNQNHEKILSVFIAILLTLCLDTAVFAVEVDEAGGAPVQMLKRLILRAEPRHCLQRGWAWGSMEFTITTLRLEPGTIPMRMTVQARRAGSGRNRQQNHRNQPFQYSDYGDTFFYEKAGFEGIDGSFSKSIINLDTAVGTLPAAARQTALC